MNNAPGDGPFFIRVVDCGNHGGGRRGRRGGGNGGNGGRRGGHRGGHRNYRVYRPCGACQGHGQQHRHDCPRNSQRMGLHINSGQNISQWLNNIPTPGQVVSPYHSFGHFQYGHCQYGHCHHGQFHQRNLMLHAPRNSYANALASIQYQLQLESQYLMQQQAYMQMQLQRNQYMRQRVLEMEQQQEQAGPMLQLPNGTRQQGRQQNQQDEDEEDDIE